MIVLLAGPIAVGKSTVARELAARSGGRIVSARELLLSMTEATEDRASLQEAGARLDLRTNGRWLLEALIQQTDPTPQTLTVLDSARTVRQTEPVLTELTRSRLVYLEADDESRRARFASSAQQDMIKRRTNFDASNAHKTERDIRKLKRLAHHVIDTSRLSLEETLADIEEFVVRR